jgi:hypothetical protein
MLMVAAAIVALGLVALKIGDQAALFMLGCGPSCGLNALGALEQQEIDGKNDG